MTEFATLDEVKHHLRYDDDDSDEILTIYLQSAEKSVKNYITDEITDEMLPSLKVATLLMVGYLDDNRNSENGANHGNYLPPAVRQMLAPYRTPAF
ncbi:head-tail connector protein [Moraxella bovis]|uniref:head-tail connector protein n=1 Tax=Moraxella bovis TaxID=476 RepID=UPI000DC7ABA8|nr:head-tail connector protein [Moraxella bovis]AWY19843.1 phage gp6-like head-tail connector protein [Moraxella bovis]UZA25236.1 head-tail connector protein [Moraxella bovis]UZA29280.1 head-tail connector protein [Moraxella bovis]